MKNIGAFLSFLGPVVIIGGLLAFLGYALFLYKPNEHLACGKNAIEQQADIAVHVIRQWAGKEGQLYLGCPES